MYASQTPNENPGVLMERAEAEGLYGAIDRARQRIVREVARIGRSRLPEPEKKTAVAALRADLDKLAAFSQALGEAHDLGGH